MLKLDGSWRLGQQERLELVTAWMEQEEERPLEELRKEVAASVADLPPRDGQTLWKEALSGYFALHRRRFDLPPLSAARRGAGAGAGAQALGRRAGR
jgi:hypothetical protein